VIATGCSSTSQAIGQLRVSEGFFCTASAVSAGTGVFLENGSVGVTWTDEATSASAGTSIESGCELSRETWSVGASGDVLGRAPEEAFGGAGFGSDGVIATAA